MASSALVSKHRLPVQQ